MFLDELTTYKTKLLSLLCNSKDIIDLMACGKEIEYGDDLVYKQIFPYAYMLDTQTEQTVFICCDVEVPRMGESNDMFKYSALHVYILVHGSLMQTPNGTRLDLLADKVDRLLSRNRDFGIGGGLSLVSLKRFMPNEEYYGVELYYEGCDFHNANCTPRNVK